MSKPLDDVKDGKRIMCETRRRMEAADLGRGLKKLDHLLFDAVFI